MEDNPELSLAYKYIQNTNTNVFLTGKAGTGKTTFLKQLVRKTSKRYVVLAPTGVAALQAKGVTIHSFFQLPFHIYIPETLPQTKRFRKSKINLIRSLDLIIIDEISMVRCDVMDEIDFLLRRFRYNARNKPFGGVQMLMIGDLSQLPPVVKEDEAKELSPYYSNFYFFSSRVLQKSKYITITLQHIYRQKDNDFITVLNAIRNNCINQTIIDTLNTRYKPDILKHIPDNHIVLCTHNNQADEINDSKIKDLKTKQKIYKADIDGEFPENIFPVEANLLLKVDAQVMFVKNDYSQETNRQKRYYNGKIGRVKQLKKDSVIISCSEDEEDIVVEKYTWENIRYTLDKNTKKISEEIIGTFTQFPLKLAWAVTIHKSQGLTFDNVIINSNRAFSHGQVYVALSRCKTLDGVVLTDKFKSASVILDNNITEYKNLQKLKTPDESTLKIDEQLFEIENIISIFDFSELTLKILNLEDCLSDIENYLSKPIYKQSMEVINGYKVDIQQIAKKFSTFLEKTGNANVEFSTKIEKILSRGVDAKKYFIEKLTLLNPMILNLVDTELKYSDDTEYLQELVAEVAMEKELKYRLLDFFNENFDNEKFIKQRNYLLAQGNSLSLKSIEEE